MAMWILYSIGAGLSKTSNQVFQKRALSQYGALEINMYTTVIVAALMSPALFIPGLFRLPADPAFWLYINIAVLVNCVSPLIVTHAMRLTDMSLCLPFMAFVPLFAIGPNWLFNGEAPSLFGFAGVALIVLGALLTGAHNRAELLRLASMRVFLDRGVQWVLLASFLYGCNYVPYKRAIALADEENAWYAGPVTTLLILSLLRPVYLVAVQLIARHRLEVERPHKRPCGDIAACGIFHWLEILLEVLALPFGHAAYVNALKRLGNITSSLAGFWLFKERFTWFRMAGVIVLTLGAIAIAIGS